VIIFTRGLRTNPPAPSHEIQFPTPKPAPKAPAFSPAIILSALVMSGAMAISMPGGSHTIRVAVMGGGMALVALSQFGYGKLQASRAGKRLEADYKAKLSEVRSEIREAHAAELAWLDSEHPTTARCFNHLTEMDAALFERRPTDPDFLHVRVATGTIRSSIRSRSPSVEDAPLAAEAQHLKSTVGSLEAAPIVIDLRTVGVGISGEPGAVSGLLNALIVQLLTRHSPTELKLSFVGTALPAALSLVPHAASNACLATTTSSAAQLLDPPYQPETSEQGGTHERHLVVIDETAGRLVEDRILLNLLREGPDKGITVILARLDARSLPGEGIGAVVECQGLDARVLAPGKDPAEGLAERASARELDAVAKKLAGVQVIDPSTSTKLPELVTLSQLMDGIPDASGIRAAWRSWTGAPSAQIGIISGRPLVLDLDEDGPHGLIAGRAGWGKSEALVSIAVSLAASVPPEGLNLLFIDFKGESAFGPLAKLPHTSYLLSNLDATQNKRIVASLNAEIERRQRFLASVGAKDIKSLPPGEILPRLLILVDEFREMKQEAPEFVAGLVRVATVGRSLGVHLILATQRPAGVVDDQIRANTGFRLCLAVASKQDSQEMIGSDRAARITVRGRAYLEGQDTISAVQIAFTGAQIPRAREGIQIRDLSRRAANHDPSIVIRDIRTRVATATSKEEGPTELEALIDAIVQAGDDGGHPRAMSPVAAPLPKFLTLSDLESDGSRLQLGVRDEPENQRIVPHVLDLDESPVIGFVGVPGTGKTEALASLSLELAKTYAPGDLEVVGFDFASRRLGALDALPHCKGIINGDDAERIRRALRMIAARVRDPSHGRLLVLVDNLPEMVAYLSRTDRGQPLDELQALISALRGSRVTLAFTAMRRESIPNWIQVSTTPFMLRQAEKMAFEWAGMSAREAPEHLPAGTAVSAGHLVRLPMAAFAVPTPGEDPLKSAVAELSSTWTGSVKRIGWLPDMLDLPPRAPDATFVLGVDDDLEEIRMELETGATFFIVGSPRSGRSSLLVRLATWGVGIPTFAFAAKPSPLTQFATVYRNEEEMAQGVVAAQETPGPRLILVDDAELVPSALSDRLARIAEEMRPGTVVAVTTSVAKGRSPMGISRAVRELGYGILLCPENASDGDAFLTLLSARELGKRTPGRGLIRSEGRLIPIQVGFGEPVSPDQIMSS
jgi:DNA segregation ATPase FtsK/SpoIIIE, S-DNA-T family